MHSCFKKVSAILDDAEPITDPEFLSTHPVPHATIAFLTDDLAKGGNALLRFDARRVDPDVYEIDGFYIALTNNRFEIPQPVFTDLIRTSAGRSKFCDLDFEVFEGVFWPNPANEDFVTVTLRHAANSKRIVDVGCGCGVIALCLAHALPDAQVIGTDSSELAITCSIGNRRRLGIDNARFVCGDLLEPVTEFAPFDAIVANLPWLSPVDVALGTLEHTTWSGPSDTVQGQGEDGLLLLRRVVEDARKMLMPGGLLMMIAQGWQREVLEAEMKVDYDCQSDGYVLVARLKTAAA